MEYRPRLTQDEYKVISDYRNRKSTVLVIPDPHIPFIKKGFLEFCIDMRAKYNPTQILFTGDILDNHASSYHEQDPDGYSAGAELSIAQRIVKQWAAAFPVAKVVVGNHDKIPGRKIMSGGVSKNWLRSPNEVLGVDWEFCEEFMIDNVYYTHGDGCTARTRSKNEMVSICQGHWHSTSYIEWNVGPDRKTFAMQLGCGIDRRTYAMVYGKNNKKPHINCGIIIDGELPIIEYMPLT